MSRPLAPRSMRYSAGSPFRRVIGSLLGASILVSGCSTWRIEQVAPAEVIARDHPSRLRVRTGTSHWEVLYRPAILGDSLLGRPNSSTTTNDRAVALPDVTAVATSHFSPGKTAAVGLGVAGGVGLVFLIMLAKTASDFGS